MGEEDYMGEEDILFHGWLYSLLSQLKQEDW